MSLAETVINPRQVGLDYSQYSLASFRLSHRQDRDLVDRMGIGVGPVSPASAER